jgi:ribosome biogenesis GTPase A
MAKAMVALQRVIKHVDLVLEVRDARVRGAVA